MRSLLTNICISLFSLMLILGVCEGSFRLLQHYGVLPVFSKKLIDKGDTPNKNVNAKLVKSSNPVLFMEFDRQDPNINNAGFRGADFVLQKQADTTRIAILGDSVAYGYSVPLEQTFARLLEKKLNENGRHIEVLNFAVNGYSTIAELELYKTRVREYKPDVVLLAYVLNDPLPAAFVVQSVGSARKQTDYFKQLSHYSQFGAWVYLRWQTLTQPMDRQRNYQAMYNNPDSWANTQNALAELATLAREDETRLGAVIFPLLLDFNAYPMKEIHRQVGASFQSAGIPYIDLLADFSQIPYMALRPHPNDDTHPNATGHEIAARKIAQFVEEQLIRQ
jgi:lysophospholipase L1-like esterase